MKYCEAIGVMSLQHYLITEDPLDLYLGNLAKLSMNKL